MKLSRLLILLALILITGCSSDDGSQTDATPDTSTADTAADTSAPDTTADASLDAADTTADTTADATPDVADTADVLDIADTTDVIDPPDVVEDITPDTSDSSDAPLVSIGEPGFGAITGGDCDMITAVELASPSPLLLENRLDFGTDPFDEPEDVPLLTPGGQEILADGNAGGSSVESEIFAYEMLYRCDLATLLKSENEIVYDTPGKITDLLVEIEGLKVGVSVTRGFGHPQAPPYSLTTAQDLLESKLGGVLQSTANVSAEDAWVKQILYVMVYSDLEADLLRQAFTNVDAAIKSDTIVIFTITDGADDPIYF